LADREAVVRAVAPLAVLDLQAVSHPGDVSMSHNSVPLARATQPDRPICMRADVKTARTPRATDDLLAKMDGVVACKPVVLSASRSWIVPRFRRRSPGSPPAVIACVRGGSMACSGAL